MAEALTINNNLGAALRQFFYSQFFITPKYPTHSFAGQTVIVTGSNVGLGLEAARHFYRLGCAKLILAVRTVSKGETAKEDIVGSVKARTDGATAIEVWALDLASTASTKAFAERVKAELARVDAVVENAGINNLDKWVVVAEEGEGNIEQTVQVNVLNTLLLALLVLPKLQETKAKFPDSSPHLEIVSSEAHRFSKFPEINAPDLYATLNDEKAFTGFDRYATSKLMEVLFVRELVARLDKGSSSSSTPPVTITLVNPGLCTSTLVRSSSMGMQVAIFLLMPLLARTTEVGGRTLVQGACAGPESHGEFMSDARNQRVEEWIYSPDVGVKVQAKLFDQTMKVLESRVPGVGKAVGL